LGSSGEPSAAEAVIAVAEQGIQPASVDQPFSGARNLLGVEFSEKLGGKIKIVNYYFLKKIFY
jgi:hypothetical protein